MFAQSSLQVFDLQIHLNMMFWFEFDDDLSVSIGLGEKSQIALGIARSDRPSTELIMIRFTDACIRQNASLS